MDRRLALILLIFLPALVQAQIGGFSLPGVGDLEKQITESACLLYTSPSPRD